VYAKIFELTTTGDNGQLVVVDGDDNNSSNNYNNYNNNNKKRRGSRVKNIGKQKHIYACYMFLPCFFQCDFVAVFIFAISWKCICWFVRGIFIISQFVTKL